MIITKLFLIRKTRKRHLGKK